MQGVSRRRFLQLAVATGGVLALGDLADPLRLTRSGGFAYASDPIKVGIIDPLTSPYKTSSIHDVHGATVAVDRFSKDGGVLRRPVAIIEADDASRVETAVQAARKLITDERVNFLMGTFNGDVALAVAEVAKRENPLFLVTGAHVPELTGARCNSHTFVFMPSARMLSRAVTPHLAKAYGNRWFMITAETMDGRAAEQAMTEALLGFDLGSEDQQRQFATVHSGCDRQVQPHPHLALLPRLCGDDADFGGGPARGDDRDAGRNQGTGGT